MILVAALSIIHLSVPMAKLYQVAEAGEYGGYIGFVMNFLFLEIFKIGSVGTAAVFLVMLLIGILLTFEVSLVAILRFLKPEIKLVRIKD